MKLTAEAERRKAAAQKDKPAKPAKPGKKTTTKKDK